MTNYTQNDETDYAAMAYDTIEGYETFTVSQAAARLGIKPATVFSLLARGKLKGEECTGVIDIGSVLEYETKRNKGRIKNIDKILAVLEADDGICDWDRGYTPGGRLPKTGLTDQERAVLKKRGKEFFTLDAIQKWLGINSRQRVNQIIQQAIKRFE